VISSTHQPREPPGFYFVWDSSKIETRLMALDGDYYWLVV